LQRLEEEKRLEIFVDADACPVKDEVYAVAGRYGVAVALVANARMHVPPGMAVEMIVVPEGPDAADDWIAENVRAGDVVVTADIPLAARCLERDAAVLAPNGRPFDEESIGSRLAGREIAQSLRDQGAATGGPPPISGKDRARFSGKLDELVQKAIRGS